MLGEIYKYKRCGISKTLEHKSRPRCKEEVFLQRNLKNLRMAVCKFFPLFFEHTITTLLFVTTHIMGLNRNSFHKMKHTHTTQHKAFGAAAMSRDWQCFCRDLGIWTHVTRLMCTPFLLGDYTIISSMFFDNAPYPIIRFLTGLIYWES